MNYYLEKEKQLPVEGSYDIVVVGGGSAGWAAAWTAARCGAEVLLVERDMVLGGTAGIAMMHMFGSPYEYTQGLLREVIDELAAEGNAKPGPLNTYDGQAYIALIFRKLQEAGVHILLGTILSDVIMDGNRVTGIIIENKSGRQAVFGEVIIDASGDGDVAAKAGAEFVLGRTADHKMRPITLLFRIGNIHVEELLDWVEKNPREFKDDENSHIINHEIGSYRLHGFFNLAAQGRDEGLLDPDCNYIRFEYVWPDRGTAIINSTRVYGVNGLLAEDLTKAVITGREQMDKLFRFIKSRIPGCQDIYIVEVAAQPGVRETRHIVGDYWLEEADLEFNHPFDDILFRDYRRMVPGAEVHSPDAGEGKAGDRLERDEARRLFTFSLPYRCFTPKNLEGLLVAGRCISVEHMADGWTRDTPCCFLMGQGTGAAAAYAVRHHTKIREVDLNQVRAALNAFGVNTDRCGTL